MEIKAYNQKGEEIGKTLLPKEVFGLKSNPDLIHQILVIQQANRRKPIAHTKTRRDVSGGGRKPWRQKGTGKARHGSIRSPLWKGGGVTFGPRSEINYKKEAPKKMRRKALFMVLSRKAEEKLIIVVDKLEIGEPKSKKLLGIFENLQSKIKDLGKESVLIALSEKDKNLASAARNIRKVKIMLAKDLNVSDVLSSKYLILPKESIKVIKETFLK